jgi:hypothetical protein
MDIIFSKIISGGQTGVDSFLRLGRKKRLNVRADGLFFFIWGKKG